MPSESRDHSWVMGNVVRNMITGDKKVTYEDNYDEMIPNSSEEDTLVVIEDYPPPAITDPIFRLGEKLRVIKKDIYWWKVSTNTGKVSYIPDAHVAKLYHGWLFEGLERHKAEELLLLPANRVGSFLVRESSKERGVYSLSVKHRHIKHYRIFRLDNSWYYISPRLTFQCLEDMINHYSDSADGLCCMLTTPCLSNTTIAQTDTSAIGPPVVMRCNFDWKNVDGRQLENPENCNENLVSYGVRNSIAAHLFFSQEPTTREDRKKKSKSVSGFPKNTEYMDNF
ncbi:src like adaptor 1a [Eucyclogobius newberryi]|uniref:src like adaptor 1a n=1 Tax=Eucyclogobius newberryi TaxID=166745 RepID=UPI003B5C50E9